MYKKLNTKNLVGEKIKKLRKKWWVTKSICFFKYIFLVLFKISELLLKENSSAPQSSTFKRFSSELFFKECFKAQISFRGSNLHVQ